jgi:ATP-binding cassette, subfamily G (WHITE), member 2
MSRERAAGSYRISAYFLAKTIADMFVEFTYPVLYSVTVYKLAGLQDTGNKMAIFIFLMVLCSYCAKALANAVSCVCVNIELSTVVLALLYEVIRMFGGFYIPPAAINEYPNIKFADVLSFMKYANIGAEINEYDGLLFSCTAEELSPSGACLIAPIAPGPYKGSDFLNYYGYNQYTIPGCFGALVVYLVCCRIIGYTALRFIKN